MAGAGEIVAYVVVALMILCKCCDVCGCGCLDDPMAIQVLMIWTIYVFLFIFFLILSPLWLPFYPFLKKNIDDDPIDDEPHPMESVVEFYLYLLCLLLSPAWGPALWIEMCMEKYENETWPKFENDTTTLLNGYTRGVCWLYWLVIFIPVAFVAYLIEVILLLITALLKLPEVDITSHLGALGGSIISLLYMLTWPIWFPFWICRSCCFSKADSDKELERDTNDTPAKNVDNLANGDAATTDGQNDITDHNTPAQDDETGGGCVVDDQVDEEKGDDHQNLGTTSTTKSKEMIAEDQESGKDIIADQETGAENRSGNHASASYDETDYDTDDASAGVDREDDFVVDDQVDEEKGDDHGVVGTATTKSKEMTMEDKESGRDNSGKERTKCRSWCEIDNGSEDDETIISC